MTTSLPEDIWEKIIRHPEDLPFQSLPARMLMMRVRMLTRDKTTESYQEAIRIVRDFFEKNKSILKDDYELVTNYFGTER